VTWQKNFYLLFGKPFQGILERRSISAEEIKATDRMISIEDIARDENLLRRIIETDTAQ
jgi:hypothetical protein